MFLGECVANCSDNETRNSLNNSIVEKLEKDLMFLGFIGIQDKIAENVEGKLILCSL